MDFNEEIKKILGNAEIDEEAKQTAISKLVGENFVPSKKYSEDNATLKNKVKELENQVKTKDTEISGLKASNLTDAEKLEKIMKEMNKAKAEKILSQAGLGDAEISDMIDDIVSENTEVTENLANKIANTFTKQKEAIEKKVKEDLINNTPKPNGGNANKTMTKDEFFKLDYASQVEYKEKNPEMYKKIME